MYFVQRGVGKDLDLLKCPDCGTRNESTNLFCPMCGHSFLDDTPEAPHLAEDIRHRPVVKGVENRRLFMIVAVVVVIVLGLAAGLTSFLVSREIERSSLVPVQSGVLWKCSTCGRIYKNRVRILDVKKSERYEYGVETVAGQCYTCKYGALVGQYEDLIEYLSRQGFFGGYELDIADEAALFISQHPDLFPTGDASAASAVSQQADPRLVERNYKEYAGKPVAVTGTVQNCEVLDTKTAGEVSCIQMSPVVEKGQVVNDVLVIYKGSAPVFKGDTAVFYLLPVDAVSFRGQDETGKVVLAVAMCASQSKGAAKP